MGSEAPVPVRLSEADGRRLCTELYWKPAVIEILAGYDDRSFLVHDSSGTEFVLKIAPTAADREIIELQGRVLKHLETVDAGSFPHLVPSRQGHSVEEVVVDGGSHLVRMLTYLPGHLLVALAHKPAALLAELGDALGRLDLALSELDEAAARRRLDWDVARLGEVPALSSAIRQPAARRRVEAVTERYVERRLALRPAPRRGLIHNDANDRNVLVSSLDPMVARFSGLIDFGDLVESDLLVELAVAMAYAGLGTDDPWSTALPVLAGYHRQLPLTEGELDLLFPAMCARLALSVCMSARRAAEGLADDYALASEAPAWAALEILERIDPAVATDAARRSVYRATADV